VYPNYSILWVNIAQCWGVKISDARVSQLSHPGHFDPINNLSNQMVDFKSRKNTLIVYSTIALTTVLLLWVIVALS
jgi:hypothetical protein